MGNGRFSEVYLITQGGCQNLTLGKSLGIRVGVNQWEVGMSEAEKREVQIAQNIVLSLPTSVPIALLPQQHVIPNLLSHLHTYNA